MKISEAHSLWEPQGVFCNTASYGLPPRPAWEALQFVGLDPSDSAIVCADIPGAAQRLQEAGIIAAVRGGLLRTSWHVYNDESDVDEVLSVIRP
jgi:selenocysteine lyase/cysteine desulfurase